VDVSVAVPRLAVDRPFTYVLQDEMEAGIGSLVSVPFHGRTVKGWVLGPASDVPEGRLLPVRKVRSRVRFFDDRLLSLFRWMRERYVAPLSTVIERSHPPRVAGEEAKVLGSRAQHRLGTGFLPEGVLKTYGAERILDEGTTGWLRPLPGEEATTCAEAVSKCIDEGKQAIVLVPEAEPVPATAATVLEAAADRAVAFLGGDERSRYRTWLEIAGGWFDVVVGTRPAVFAPLPRLGLIWISREVHPGHREERAPYYHVRDVAMARAGIDGAACVLAAFAPSVETAVACRAGAMSVFRAARGAERGAAPLVETTPPEAEDRSVRLGALLKKARSAALIVSRRGYGVARVCRSCGSPAACANCQGPIVVERGRAECRVCTAPGTCRICGSHAFGVERGGVERVAEWAARTTGRNVDQELPDRPPPVPGRSLMVGTAAVVKDWGSVRVDLVAILDPDRAITRPGIHAGERALAAWMEAAAWAGSREGGGRVLAQTRHGAHAAVQSLIRWEPQTFLEQEAAHRAEAGFEPLRPLFRVTGDRRLPESLQGVGASMLVSTSDAGRTTCLVSVQADGLSAFRESVVRLSVEGVVDRVEAEPQM
jgi:primosomal protein N' (replication factor Y) (superfamily II helicase)